MPNDGYFFDTIIRQEPIDEDTLDPEDNLEEFRPIADEDIEYFAHAKWRAPRPPAAPSWPISAAPRSATSRWCPDRS